MAIDLTTLKNEFLTDPVAIGYLPLADSANDVANADLINNADGQHGRTLDKAEIMTSDLVAATTLDAYTGLSANETSYYDMITNREQVAVTDDTKANLAGVGGTSIWAVADRATMEARVLALMQRAGSRAEELFGNGAHVTTSDVANARNA